MSLHHPGLPIPDQDTGAQSAQDFPARTARPNREAIGELRALDERGVLAEALTLLGDHARHSGSPVMAAFHYADALALHYERGARLELAHGLERVAHLAVVRGKPILAAWFLGSAATIRRAMGAPPLPTEQRDLQATATAVRAHGDDDAVAAAWAAGAAVSPEDAIAQALAFLLTPGDAGENLPAQAQRGLSAPAATAATCDLTRREREVLGLLCQHRSDAEIGDRLYIGVRTVEFHVANILHKLGAENRHAAAALATRRRLVSR